MERSWKTRIITEKQQLNRRLLSVPYLYNVPNGEYFGNNKACNIGQDLIKFEIISNLENTAMRGQTERRNQETSRAAIEVLTTETFEAEGVREKMRKTLEVKQRGTTNENLQE